jgi:hypothetical protein
VPVNATCMESSLPAEIVAEFDSLVHEVSGLLMLQATTVAAPSSRRVNVHETPAPGGAVSLTARSRATIVEAGDS